ncbi:MAG: carboxypeptidase-like regulatory domain-containing protein, partial [Bryobacteraceae bacterium]|nr:carboxypeptidase-like regulatory domain-containing protein [Bryobacteraceae bacterium]
MKARLLIGLLWVSAAFAQQDRGLITGVVKDSSGAIIPDANITATRVETNSITKTTSASSGDYTVPSLEIGTYNLRVEKQGFKTAVANSVVVSASGTTRLDMTLEVGTTLQTVEVVAQGAQVQTENARIQTAVANRLVDQLPLVVGGQLRSPFDLALLTPETKAPNNANDNFAIGGGQAATYGVSLDGVSSNTGRALQTQWAAMNTPSLDAISEFTVDSNGFKAEYGRAQGGQMSFVSKSGTNDFHGNAFEFLRNDALDAGFYNKATRKPVYKQHDFGGTFGGPVTIPKIYNGKNKSFFFVSYEGFRNREGANPSFLSVAPREFYDGNFANWVDNNNNRIIIFDPASASSGTRTPFPNNAVPAARFDRVFRAMSPIGQTALPNVPGITPGTSGYVRNNFIQSGTQVAPWDKFSIRGDQNLSEAHRLSFYFSRNTRSTAPGAAGPIGLPGFLNGNNYNNTLSRQYRLSWDWTISANKINRFYAGGNDWREINRALAV